MKPTDFNHTQFRVPDVTLQLNAEYTFVVKEGKKDPVTLSGNLYFDL